MNARISIKNGRDLIVKIEQLNENFVNSSSEVNDFFDESYSKIYSRLLEIELDEQVDFLRNNYYKELSDENKKALDLCCGTGRHLKKMRENQVYVDGVDINQEAVLDARHNNPGLEIYTADARNFNPGYKYDLIYSMESSFGYLSDEETIEIFKNISHSLLRETGTFVMHLINREFSIKNLTQRVWFGDKDNGYLLEDRIFDVTKGVLRINQVRIIDGMDKKYSINLRLYSLNEIKNLLKEAGLCIKEIYGDYQNSKYDIDAPYMIIECSKSN